MNGINHKHNSNWVSGARIALGAGIIVKAESKIHVSAGIIVVA